MEGNSLPLPAQHSAEELCRIAAERTANHDEIRDFDLPAARFNARNYVAADAEPAFGRVSVTSPGAPISLR